VEVPAAQGSRVEEALRSPDLALVPELQEIQYSLVLEHLLGDRRPVKPLHPGVMAGLPVPQQTPEQKAVERAMESCGFKATLACVGGTGRGSLLHHYWPQ